MSESQLFMQILLGGLLGMLGQGIRIAVGLKKVNERAGSEGKAFRDVFDGRLMLISLLLGFVAGALAIIMLSEADAPPNGSVQRDLLLGIVAAGYMGTDFIEGFIKKYVPKV